MPAKKPANPLQKAAAAIRINLRPGLLLWLFAASFILFYYTIPPFNYFLNQIGKLKTQYSYLFSVISTALFGSIIPSLFLLVYRKEKMALSALVFTALFWAIKGIEVDFVYRLQALIWGDNSKTLTILLKVAADQLIYVPFWAVPQLAFFYHLRNKEFKPRSAIASWGKKWYTQRILPMLIANWCIWIPAVSVIYMLPLPLQLPTQNFILCFFVLVASVTSKQE